mmetsp:Transcript_32084/g.39795  ORF Transcript_32084/g.39795 Transcript_32084/m.39795 type:complete len:108 (-) Transcript_32084:79-402(-)
MRRCASCRSSSSSASKKTIAKSRLLTKKLKTIKAEKDAIQAKKEEEIKELTQYIDTMHNSFASMLKKTLEKMKDRIKRANDAWAKEQDQKLIEKFQNIIQDGGQVQT